MREDGREGNLGTCSCSCQKGDFSWEQKINLGGILPPTGNSGIVSQYRNRKEKQGSQRHWNNQVGDARDTGNNPRGETTLKDRLKQVDLSTGLGRPGTRASCVMYFLIVHRVLRKEGRRRESVFGIQQTRTIYAEREIPRLTNFQFDAGRIPQKKRDYLAESTLQNYFPKK